MFNALSQMRDAFTLSFRSKKMPSALCAYKKREGLPSAGAELRAWKDVNNERNAISE